MSKQDFENADDFLLHLSEIMEDEPEEAEAEFRALLKEDPGDASLLHRLVSTLKFQNKIEEALDVIREPFYERPNNTLLYATYTLVLDMMAPLGRHDLIAGEKEFYENWKEKTNKALPQLETLFDLLEDLVHDPPSVPEGCKHFTGPS